MGHRHSQISNGNGDSADHNQPSPPQTPPVESQPDGDPTQVNTQPPPVQSTSTSDPTSIVSSSSTHTISQNQSPTPSPTTQQSQNLETSSEATVVSLQTTTITESNDGTTRVIVSTIMINTEQSSPINGQPMLAATASISNEASSSTSRSDLKMPTQSSSKPTEDPIHHSNYTVTSVTPTTITQSSVSSASASSESEKPNGFLANKPAAIATFVLSSLLFLVVLGICTGLIYKYRRRRHQTQLEAQPTAFRFDPDNDGITQTRSGILQPNRRGDIIQSEYTKEVDQCHLAGGPTAPGTYIPPPEYQENGYGYGYGFGTGKNHDEKPREDTRIGHDVDGEDTQPAELMSPTSDAAFSDMITSNDDHNHRRMSRETYTSAQNSRSSLIST